MAFANIGPLHVSFPPIPYENSDLVHANANINAAGEYGSQVVQLTEDRVITGIGIIVQLLSGGSLRLQLETIGSNGHPTGTLIDANATVDVAGANLTLVEGAFPASVSVAQGTQFAVVIRQLSGNFHTYRRANIQSGAAALPYTAINTGALSILNSSFASAALKDANGYFPAQGLIPSAADAKVDFTSATGEVGFKFIAPDEAMEINGFWVVGEFFRSTTVRVYDDTTLIKTITVLAHTNVSTGSYVILFDDDLELVPGNPYRITFENLTGSINTLPQLAIPDALLDSAYELDIEYTSKPVATFIDDATKRVMAGLMLASVEAALSHLIPSLDAATNVGDGASVDLTVSNVESARTVHAFYRLFGSTAAFTQATETRTGPGVLRVGSLQDGSTYEAYVLSSEGTVNDQPSLPSNLRVFTIGNPSGDGDPVSGPAPATLEGQGDLDLQLDDDCEDLVIPQLDLGLVDGTIQVKQALCIALRTFRGEWFLDSTAGVPYYQEILVKTPDLSAINSALKTEILKVEHVNKILEFSSVFDGAARELTVTFRVDTTFGPVTVEETL